MVRDEFKIGPPIMIGRCACGGIAKHNMDDMIFEHPSGNTVIREIQVDDLRRRMCCDNRVCIKCRDKLERIYTHEGVRINPKEFDELLQWGAHVGHFTFVKHSIKYNTQPIYTMGQSAPIHINAGATVEATLEFPNGIRASIEYEC